MGIAVLVVSNLSGATHGFALLARVVGSIAVGTVVYGAVVVALGRRHEARRRQSRRHDLPRRLSGRHAVRQRF